MRVYREKDICRSLSAHQCTLQVVWLTYASNRTLKVSKMFFLSKETVSVRSDQYLDIFIMMLNLPNAYNHESFILTNWKYLFAIVRGTIVRSIFHISTFWTHRRILRPKYSHSFLFFTLFGTIFIILMVPSGLWSAPFPFFK